MGTSPTPPVEASPGGPALRCPGCLGPLGHTADAAWARSFFQGAGASSTGIRPDGAQANLPEAALLCDNPNCRRVYLIWDGVPNLLEHEYGARAL